MIHHVFGNGESRKDLDIDKLEGTKYGCNAIYRDYKVDYLFTKDKPIQREILDSEVWRNTIVMIQTRWYDQSYYREGYSMMKLWKDMIGTNDFTDCGSAVLTFASKKARSYGGDVHMYGFDFDKADSNYLNNIYKGTPNYSSRPNQRKGVTKEFLECIEKFKDVQYVYHGDKLPDLLTKYENVR